MNTLDVLGDLSGLSKEEMKTILAEVKENIKKLNSCEGPHNFVPLENKTTFKDFTCSKCCGTISKFDHSWYTKGLEHGKKIKPDKEEYNFNNHCIRGK